MRPRYIISVLVLACFAALALWIIVSWRDKNSRIKTLPDGSLLILRRVSYGTTHQFSMGTFWQQLGAHILPKQYTPRFQTLGYNDTNNGPTMVVWLEHLSRTSPKNIVYGGHPTYGDPPDWQGLFDDYGTDFDRYYADVAAASGNRFVQGFVFHVIPTTSRELHFRFVCADTQKGWQASEVFTFRNPCFQPATNPPVAYPLRFQQGSLAVVLTKFHPKPHRKGAPKEMSLSLDLFEDGHPAKNWRLHSLVVLNPNGALYHPYSSGWGQFENHIDATFAGGLSTNAPWKLRFGFKRAAFLTSELCTVTNVPIAAAANRNSNSVQVPFQGTTLLLQPQKSDLGLEAMLVPADENYYLNFVSVLAANGHPFERSNTFYGGQTDSNYLIGFPPDVTNVALTFGITRKVFIDAMAQPGFYAQRRNPIRPQ